MLYLEGKGEKRYRTILMAEPDLSGLEGLTEGNVEHGHKGTEQDHGDEYHDGGFIEFTVLGKALFLGIPRPGGFFHFKNDFAKIFADSAHLKRVF